MEKDGEVIDFNFFGFDVIFVDWECFVNDFLSWLGQFDMVCVSGSLLVGVSLEVFIDWMMCLCSQCLCIIFDSSCEVLVVGFKVVLWLVKLNCCELEIWVGCKFLEMKDVIDVVYVLCEQGIVYVVILLGVEGVLWVNVLGEWIVKLLVVDVVSIVGVGDFMVGGLIYGLLMCEFSEYMLCLVMVVVVLVVSQSNVGIIDCFQLVVMMVCVDL